MMPKLLLRDQQWVSELMSQISADAKGVEVQLTSVSERFTSESESKHEKKNGNQLIVAIMCQFILDLASVTCATQELTPTETETGSKTDHQNVA